MFRVGLARSFSLTTAALAAAQATGGISGTARDQGGGVLPGVTVTATNTETGATRVTVSNETGAYSLPNLPLGSYRLEAALQGFTTFTQTGIVLQVNSNPVINPTLGIGAVAEQVQVTAAATLVDTRTVGVATVVESERIVELPLNARQVTQLITLSGVAVQTAASPGYGMNTGVRISVAGSNDFGVTYTLDGAPNSNVHDGTGLHLPFPDALQEFRLTTGAQEASSGLRSGASVSAVTKSGTNVLHGSLFEFNRDSRFSSPDFFSNQKDGLKRNQFGGTIGGPIREDRVFFFAGYQGTTTRQMPLNATAFVPTAAMMAGDFTRLHVARLQRRARGGAAAGALRRQPAAGGASSARRRSPSRGGCRRRSTQCGRVFTGLPNNQNEAQIPIRLDFQASQAHSFFGRYMLTTDTRVGAAGTRTRRHPDHGFPGPGRQPLGHRRRRARVHAGTHVGHQLVDRELVPRRRQQDHASASPDRSSSARRTSASTPTPTSPAIPPSACSTPSTSAAASSAPT